MSPWEVAGFEGEDAITMTVLVQKFQWPLKLFYTAVGVAESGFRHLRKVRSVLIICHYECHLKHGIRHCLVALGTAPHLSTLVNLYRKTTSSSNNLTIFTLLELLKSSYVTVQPLPGLLSLQYEKCMDNSKWLRHASKFFS